MRKIPFAGIELTSQRVRGYTVPLSYRGDRSPPRRNSKIHRPEGRNWKQIPPPVSFSLFLVAHLYRIVCQAERNFSALSALLGDLQSNLGRRKVEMMMLLKLNQQLIQGLADVFQQVADLKDATNCCWQRCISVIVYWLSLTVRVLLAMYWHFRGGRYYY